MVGNPPIRPLPETASDGANRKPIKPDRWTGITHVIGRLEMSMRLMILALLKHANGRNESLRP
jgi:hypothetical protein